MATKIAINGFGRIGRCIVRALAERHIKDLELVAINDLTDAKTLAHLYNYDSVHGRAAHPAKPVEGAIVFGDVQHEDHRREGPGEAPVEGARRRHRPRVHRPLHRQGEGASRTSTAGAKKVIISAPAKGHDATIVLGVNTKVYDSAKHTIISCGSCTTNCLAPVAKVLLDIVRHRARPDDDDPLVHQRPGRPRHPPPQGRPAPRARRGRQHDPGVHRRRQGAVRGHPRAQGQVRRTGDPRPDGRRQHRRPDGRDRREPSRRTRSTRR